MTRPMTRPAFLRLLEDALAELNAAETKIDVLAAAAGCAEATRFDQIGQPSLMAALVQTRSAAANVSAEFNRREPVTPPGPPPVLGCKG